MFPFFRLLLIPVALALPSSAVAAKDRSSALDKLSGVFAESAELCRAHYRNTTNLAVEFNKVKGKYYYTNCYSRNCVNQVVGYTSGSAGLVLRLREVVAPGEPTKKLTVKRISDNQLVLTEQGRPPSTRIRCTNADFVAGIGLPSPNKRTDPESAVVRVLYYTLLVPAQCPGLTVDRDAILKRIGPPKPVIEWSVQDEPALDKAIIKDYCHAVLGAFGPNGRVIPDLLHPADSRN